MLAKLQLVEVLWVDSAFTHGWRDLKAAEEDSGVVHCRSVGYLLHDSRKRVALASSKYDEEVHAGHINEMVSEVISIPKSCIKSMRRL